MKKGEVNKNFLVLGTNPEGTTIKVLKQVGKPKSVPRDLGRTAKLPGKRISKNGKVYWETRANRSDRALNSI